MWRYHPDPLGVVAGAEQPFTMTHALARIGPFVGHVLDGFTPSVPHIRYPVTWSLTQEGPNLGLYAAPIDLALIQTMTSDLNGDRALVRSRVFNVDAPSNRPQRSIRWRDLHRLRGDVELTHYPPRPGTPLPVTELPGSVLAAPHIAVPTDAGSRLAVGFSDECHAAFITPDRRLLQRILGGFIRAYTQAASGSSTVPAFPLGTDAPLLETMAAGEWNELRFVQRRRYWLLEIVRNGDPDTAHQWVSEGPGGYWRQGWSW